MKNLNIKSMTRMKSLLVLIIFSIILINSSVVMAEESIEVNETDPVILEVEKYIFIDKNGTKKVDVDMAIEDGASKEAIEVGNVFNEISKSYQDGDLTEDDVENIISPSANLGSIGRYGNYCGLGNNGWDKYPIDDLDAACQNHDRCYVHGGNNNTCNRRFCSALDNIINYSTGAFKITYARAAKLFFC